MRNRILYISEDKEYSAKVRDFFEHNNYRFYLEERVLEGIRDVEEDNFEVVFLEMSYSDMDGVEVCKRIKTLKPNIFVVFLTERAEEYSQKAGYQAGADAYITKPIKNELLFLKLKPFLDRLKGSNEVIDRILKVGEIVIDCDLIEVYYKGNKVEVSKKEFEILHFLGANSNRYVNREEILEEVWRGDKKDKSRGSLDVYISRIRSKMDREVIQNSKGIGFILRG